MNLRDYGPGTHSFPYWTRDLQEYLAAPLVRVMALRAELAAKAGQKDVAKKWADAVLLLWGNGDAIVKSTVDRIRGLH